MAVASPTPSRASRRVFAWSRSLPIAAIVDAASTMVVDDTHVKIYAWYDNEWGYANRTAELARLVGRADRD